MKLYVKDSERFVPSNFGFVEWATIANIIVSLTSIVISLYVWSLFP